MQSAETEFSERVVQDELDRIRSEHLERGDYERAAELCDELVGKYPESKWLGNAYLMAARCHHELGRSDEEAQTLERFLEAFPQHVQAVSVRRALESLQLRYQEQVRDGHHPVALSDVEGRLQRLYEGLHDLKQRQEHLEELSRSVSSVAGQVDDLKAKAQLLAADLEGESGEPTVLELVNALIQDLRAELDAQRKRTDSRLVSMNMAIEDLKTRFKAGMRVLWASAAGALAAFALLVATVLLYQPATPAQAPVVGAPRRAAPSRAAASKPAPTPAKTDKARPGRTEVQPQVEPAAHKAEAVSAPVIAAEKADRPAQAGPPARPPAARTYKVKPGDTLWSICKSALGDGAAVSKVAAANKLKAPDYSLRVGQVLVLPGPEPRSR